ncbi:MAG TPA: DUF2945 domain-containing protein [Dongiaceae bacterium]|nr:DUF2945 domain-containing protein [Dongiaceae bacterium]
MSSTRQVLLSMEDSGVQYAENLDSGEIVDQSRADGDAPEIHIHGLDSNDPTLGEIKEKLGTNLADTLRIGEGQLSYESQQQDSANQADEIAKAEKQAEIDDAQAELDGDENGNQSLGIKHIFVMNGMVMKGLDTDQDRDLGIEATFKALNKNAIENPEHTVAAFLPVNAEPGQSALPEASYERQAEALQKTLTDQGVTCVTSVEALVDTIKGFSDRTSGISLEGLGGVKLRVGMKVKYSHGHGKIIKVFDRPTKYNGEIHHCSKEKPKFEVVALKGGHKSLHHASALTPI